MNLIKTSYSKTLLRVLLEKIIKRKIDTSQNNCVCDDCIKTLNDFDYTSKCFEMIRGKIRNYFKMDFSTVNVFCQTDISFINIKVKKASSNTDLKSSGYDSNAISISNFDTDFLRNNLNECCNVNNKRNIDKGNIEDLSILKKTGQCSNQFFESNAADEIQSKQVDETLQGYSEGSRTLSKSFICEICGQSYRHSHALKIHLDMHKGICPFICPYCNKSFTQKAALKRHLPMHTGETPHICDICGKGFKHHTSFHIHKLSHTGEKKYKCTYCKRCFLSTSHLRRHLKIHTNEKSHVCSICERSFAEKYNLLAHQKLHSSQRNNYQTATSGSLRCQVCQQVFKVKNKFLRHLSQQHHIVTDIDVNSLENIFRTVSETQVK
ncbi:zinc finger protein 32 [Agrilus planipennis]|uniref:Zinc finger protein 32 n=1 Tax=Agrilus planipennis TaxID=224129 RepID=A0A1W4WJ72_AGRPL|nr:zinc finger protein 32 [Agrilus planipennis]